MWRTCIILMLRAHHLWICSTVGRAQRWKQRLLLEIACKADKRRRHAAGNHRVPGRPNLLGASDAGVLFRVSAAPVLEEAELPNVGKHHRPLRCDRPAWHVYIRRQSGWQITTKVKSGCPRFALAKSGGRAVRNSAECSLRGKQGRERHA